MEHSLQQLKCLVAEFKFIRHRGRVYFGLVRKWDEGHIKPLSQTPAGSELAARSPQKTLGSSKFLIP